MPKCRVCGRGTFGILCGPCKEAGRGPEGVIVRARDMGFEVLWSPVNQAYVILEHPGPDSRPELVGVKNNIQDVRAFLDNEEDARNEPE